MLRPEARMDFAHACTFMHPFRLRAYHCPTGLKNGPTSSAMRGKDSWMPNKDHPRREAFQKQGDKVPDTVGKTTRIALYRKTAGSRRFDAWKPFITRPEKHRLKNRALHLDRCVILRSLSTQSTRNFEREPAADRCRQHGQPKMERGF